MPLYIEETWVDAPGTKVTLEEGRAGIIQLKAHKDFSPSHTLDFMVYKTTLYEGCRLSSKVLPLVIQLWEQKENERLTDVYSFDDNGICLSHGYNRDKDGKIIVDEQHDIDISRLVEHGATISEMLCDYPGVPVPLTIHPTMADARHNSWGKSTCDYCNK